MIFLFSIINRNNYCRARSNIGFTISSAVTIILIKSSLFIMLLSITDFVPTKSMLAKNYRNSPWFKELDFLLMRISFLPQRIAKIYGFFLKILGIASYFSVISLYSSVNSMIRLSRSSIACFDVHLSVSSCSESSLISLSFSDKLLLRRSISASIFSLSARAFES